MKYLIVQDWASTHGNHAGMVHMCQMLVERYPDQYKMIVMEQPSNPKSRQGFGHFIDSVCYKLRIKNEGNPINHYYNVVFPNRLMEHCSEMFKNFTSGDEVFLLEYLTFNAPQYRLARYIRMNYPFVRIYALSHLTVETYRDYCNQHGNVIKKWAKPIDKMMTFGSSLSRYFESMGIAHEKISTGKHYVDDTYYYKVTSLTVGSPITVIAMGAMKRNYGLLAQIVKKCSDVKWVICRGRHEEVDELFKGCSNVCLKGFLSEDELKHQMDIADVSINVMDDTIGSNVVTTSMAMGLAMVVSDVGSIRDYTNDSNALYCKNEADSFVNAIQMLAQNPDKAMAMKKSSLELAKEIDINYIHNWFSSLCR